MSARARMIPSGVMVCCAGLLMQAPVAAQDSAAQFTLSGTSTVRAWSCPAQGIMKVTPGTSSEPVPGFPTGVQTVAITVPVLAIECEEEDMRQHLREALNEPAHPEIVYQLEQYTLTGNDTAQTKGTITIAGVTRPIEFDVRLTPSSQGVRSVGETTINMTDFNITPPSLWLGMLNVGEMVRVRFEAVLPPSD